MEKRSGMGEPASSSRAWRWAREIAIAVLLTVAAAGFIAAALVRGSGGSQTPASFETARKPSGQ